MECRIVQEKLSARLEGYLSPEEDKLVEEHLSSCPLCRTTLEDLKKTGELVRTLEEVEPPAWLTQKIMSRVREEEEKRKGLLHKLFYPLHLKIPLQAVAAVFIAAIAVVVFRAVEPEMKQARLPAAPAPVITGEEAPKPFQTPEAGRPAARGQALEKHPERDRVKARPAQPADSASPSPAAPRDRESSPPSDAAQEPRKLKSSAPPPRAGEIAALKQGSLTIAIRVQDSAAAAGKVETILGGLGARKMERESRKGMENLTAEIQAEKASEFLEKLKGVGEVEKEISAGLREGEIFIRVELIGKP